MTGDEAAALALLAFALVAQEGFEPCNGDGGPGKIVALDARDDKHGRAGGAFLIASATDLDEPDDARIEFE